MEYKKRTSNPDKSNKYYYSDINPWVKKGTGSCTCYAQGRILENEALAFGTSKKKYKDTWYPVDMYSHCSECGGTKVDKPVLGGAAVWKSKELPTGHIAIIESVSEQGITFSQWDRQNNFSVFSASKAEKYKYNGMDLVGFVDYRYGFTAPAAATINYYVQSGAYTSLTNAKNQYSKIRKAGFNAICKYDGQIYRIQCGAYSLKSNAQAEARKLNAKGFSTFITTSIPGATIPMN